MKISVTLCFVMSFVASSLSQSFPIELEVKGINLQGVVFTHEYDGLNNNPDKEKITPTIDEIFEAERLLFESIDDNRSAMRFYSKAKRQYFGVLNEYGQREIHIVCLRVNIWTYFRLFKNWKDDIIWGFGDVFYKNMRYKTYVLNTQ